MLHGDKSLIHNLFLAPQLRRILCKEKKVPLSYFEGLEKGEPNSTHF